jgi:hypothetical protein
MSILKFRLTTGDIFEFNYYGYSQYIEALEPEEDIIIDLFEPFTKEDFETAIPDYLKYVEFRKLIHLIETNYKLWQNLDHSLFLSKLTDLPSFNLDFPVLEWLIIKLSKEEKYFLKQIDDYTNKNKFLYESDKIPYDMDSIFLYFIDSSTFNYKFKNACLKSHFKVMDFLYQSGKVNLHFHDDMFFTLSCSINNYFSMRWLYYKSEGKINIHLDNQYIIKTACCIGNLEMVKWLFSLEPIESFDLNNISNNSFEMACSSGNLELVEYLYTQINPKLDVHRKEYLAFRIAIERKQLNIAQWILSNFPIEPGILETIKSEFSSYRLTPEFKTWLSSI